MHVPHTFLNAAVVRHPEEMFVFFAKPMVIVEALFELRRDANHIPVVGQFLGHVRVQSKGSPPQLVDGHRGGYACQVDEHIDLVGVPAFAEQTAGADEAAGDALLKQLGDQLHVHTRAPVAPLAGQDVKAFGLVPDKVHRKFVGRKPLPRGALQLRSQVVIYQHGGAGDEHRIERVGGLVG